MNTIASVEQLPYVLALSRVRGLGQATLRRLVDRFGSPRDVWETAFHELRGCTPLVADGIGRVRANVNPHVLLTELRRAVCGVLIHGCDGYPSQLSGIPSAPLVLYVRGDASALSMASVAVVGTRRPTAYALRATDMLVDGLAGAGLCIVSGMARGVDDAAHRKALQKGVATVAVLGCGVDICYPPESHALKKAIEQSGAVISPFPPGERPLPRHFPARNRVISGLARAVVVVEAGIKSGAMITAQFAIEQERPLFAVPGSVLNDAAAGGNRLLSEGVAVLARDAGDLLAELGLQRSSVTLEVARPTDEVARRILDVLEQDPGFCGGGWIEVEEIARRSGMPSGACIRALVRMELEGHVVRAPGNLYRARTAARRNG